MTKRISQVIKTGEDHALPGESRLRLISGEELLIRRGSSVSYEVELSQEECTQLEAEGYSVKPGLSAYRPKAKAKPKKKIGAVKDVAAPTNQEESK